MAEGLGLLFKIRADASQATGELAAFQASTKAGVGSLVAEYKKASAYTADNVSATDLLIRESEKAIANSQKVALGASQALRNTSKDLEAAAKGASALGGIMSGLLTTAGIAAGYALMSMAKEAFNAAGELFDLSQKTNVSVETLSALKNAGQTSGVEIAGLSTALGILQKNMAAAHDPTSKQAELFKRLKIDIDDTEGALRTSFRALAAMGEGYRQTDAAMQLFGRSGKDVLAIIKETNGDLDGAIAKYKEMGTLISTETAKAADELGDSLTAMGQSAKATALELLTGLAPAFKVLIGIGNVVITIFKGVAKVLNDIMGTNFRRYYENLANIEEKLGTMAGRIAGRAGRTTVGGVKSILPGFGAFVTSSENAAAIETDIGGGAGSGFRGGGTGGGGGRGSGGGREEKGPDDFGGALLERLQKQYEGLTVKSNYARAAAELLNKEYAGLSRGVRQLILDQARQNDQTEREIKLRDQTRGFIAQQEEAVRQKIEGDKSEFDKVGELIAAYQAQGRELQDHIRIRLQLNALLLDSGRIMESLKGMTGPSVFGEGEVGGIVDAEGMGAAIEGLMGGEKAPVMPVPDFSAWKEAVADVKNMTVNAFGSMAEAMGAAIQAWVLYGAEGGQSIKKVMAAVLAALAAEAAVKAIFQLAEAFASLAGFNPTSAAMHFKAAALYGAVAVGAGVAGRALAGNASTQSGGAGTGPSGQTATRDNKPTPIDANRTGGEFRVVVDVRPTEAFVVRAFTEDWRKNGDTRLTVGSDGQKAVP